MKSINYYTNFSSFVETTELTQRQLRELIAMMLDASAKTWAYQPYWCPPTMPKWVENHWDELLDDPIGVVRWATQYLEVEPEPKNPSCHHCSDWLFDSCFTCSSWEGPSNEKI